MDLLHESTESLKPEDRLATRAAQSREMLIWIDDLKPPTDAETNRLWQKPLGQPDLAQKIRMEEAAHGNDVQALSIDGAGYNGPVLRELEDPEDLNVATHVPMPAETWRACPLVGSCMGKPPKRYGRTVCMSDYQEEHRRAGEKTKSPPNIRRSAASIGRWSERWAKWSTATADAALAVAATARRLSITNQFPTRPRFAWPQPKATKKFETRNPKSSTNSKSEARMSKTRTANHAAMPTRSHARWGGRLVLFRAFRIGILGLFRISCFGFRISNRRAPCAHVTIRGQQA
jgi:hypothetical protein